MSCTEMQEDATPALVLRRICALLAWTVLSNVMEALLLQFMMKITV